MKQRNWAQVLGGSLLMLGFMSFVFCSPQEEALSEESVIKLNDLNERFGMTFVPLTSDSNDLMYNDPLFQANLIDSLEEINLSQNQGLIVSLEKNSTSFVFLLQPEQNVAEFRLEELADLYEQEIPEFNSVELDQWVQLQDETPLGVELIPYEEEEPAAFPSSKEPFIPTVAIIDTGVDSTHSFFTGNEELVFLEGWDFVNQDADPDDQVGHGTHITGLIGDTTPIYIHSYKIFESEGKLSYLIQAMDKAITEDVDLINLSLGVQKPSEVLKGLVEKASKNGIVVVAAAGNFNTDACFYPACYSESLAVSAVSYNGQKNPNANYGDWVDLAGPGMPLYSSLPGGGYGYQSGTSQATAVVSQVILEFLRTHEGANSSEIAEYLNSFDKVESGVLEGLPKIPQPE